MNITDTNQLDDTPPPPSAALLARWTLNRIQAAFLTTDARFSFYVGGVGAGKTTAGAVRAIAWALDHPGSLGLIGAPTYPMLRDATQRAVFALLDDFYGDDPGYSYHKSEQRLTLPNGAEILFRSLDEPDRVRGLTLAWFWLDEAPLCGYYAWQVLKGRLRQRGYPTAGWATGTPHGRDGFAYDFELSPRPNHALYRAATQENAANLPPDYIADLGLSGAFYEQEVLGLFTAFEGLVYTLDASEGGNVANPPQGASFSRVIGGVDWGYTNPTAAAVFGIDADERVWQIDEYYQRRAPLDAVVIPALLDLTRRHNVRVWRCGPDEPEHIAALDRALIAAGLPCRAFAAANAVRPGIQTITRLLAKREDGTRGLSISPRCVHTLAEYASYQYESAPIPPGRSGFPWLPEQPLTQNDHLMDACFIAGTLVETSNGLTRAGYRRVLNAGMTNRAAQVMRVAFSNGSVLIGTPNHSAYVENVGFTEQGQKAPAFKRGMNGSSPLPVSRPRARTAISTVAVHSASWPLGLPRRSRTRRAGQARQAST